MIKYKTNCNCNLNEFHNWNNTAVEGLYYQCSRIRILLFSDFKKHDFLRSLKWRNRTSFQVFNVISKNVKSQMDGHIPSSAETFLFLMFLFLTLALFLCLLYFPVDLEVLPRDALVHSVLRLHVARLSVRLSHAGTVSKRLMLSSWGLHWRIAPWL